VGVNAPASARFRYGAGWALRSEIERQQSAFVLRGSHRRPGPRAHCVPASRIRVGRSPCGPRPSPGGFNAHVAADVVTVGLTYKIARIEASGFHGREPDEFRWDIDQGKIDSWSARLTIQQGKNWSGQYSYGRITTPEALFPAENQERMTASIMYNRPFEHGNWADSFVWGRTRSLPGNAIFNSYLLESLVRFRTRNYARTRIENVDRSNELIIGENPLPPGFEEKPVGKVQAYTLGYDRDFHLIRDLSSALGAQFTTYGVPTLLQPIYGSHPFGVALFIRLRPVSGKDR
jgi:hypothetical protein